jgi:hypothetical protein
MAEVTPMVMMLVLRAGVGTGHFWGACNRR